MNGHRNDQIMHSIDEGSHFKDKEVHLPAKDILQALPHRRPTDSNKIQPVTVRSSMMPLILEKSKS